LLISIIPEYYEDMAESVRKAKIWWKKKRKTKYKHISRQRKGYYVRGTHGKQSKVKYFCSYKRVRKYKTAAINKQNKKKKNRVVYGCTGTHRNVQTYQENQYIGIDTLSTYCITNNMLDLVNNVRKIQEKVKGISDEEATITAVGQGVLHLLDDLGEECEIMIPELYYCSTSPYRIISPQHLDKLWRENKLGEFMESTNSTGTQIQWVDHTGRKHTKAIKDSDSSGIPVCTTAPNYTQYQQFL
jgi:hypothetical protein